MKRMSSVRCQGVHATDGWGTLLVVSASWPQARQVRPPPRQPEVSFCRTHLVASEAQGARTIAVHLKWLWFPARLSSAIRDRLSTCDRSPCFPGTNSSSALPASDYRLLLQNGHNGSVRILEYDIGTGNGRCCNENIPFLLVKSMMRLIL